MIALLTQYPLLSALLAFAMPLHAADSADAMYLRDWTTDRHRAIALPKREVAEDHAARMRDLCPRNAELINVEEIAAAD